jgi:hypothetical protein
MSHHTKLLGRKGIQEKPSPDNRTCFHLKMRRICIAGFDKVWIV